MDLKVSSATENNMIASLGVLRLKVGQISQCRNPLANTGGILSSTA
jgi:hypothetical protein